MSEQQAVTKMFDGISPHYDFLNHLLSFGIDKRWRKKTSLLTSRCHPFTILDVATGTADLALRMAHDNPEATVTGLDLSEKMLEIGKQKINKKQLGHRVKLQQGDAAQMPFNDNTFDVVTSAFGVRNFEHLEQGLHEMARVTKDQGMIAVLEFSHPQKGFLKIPYRWYSKHILPLVGRTVSRHPQAYHYLPSSIEDFPDGAAFAMLLEKAGLTEVKARRFSGGIATLYFGKIQKNTSTSHNKKTQ